MNEIDKWKILLSARNAKFVKSVFTASAELSIEPVLIKGWSVARFYSSPVDRVYSDIDIAISPSLFEEAATLQSLVRREGVSLDPHSGLRHLDNLAWPAIFASSYIVDLNGTPIRVLADEDNLRVSAVHWLTDGGVSKERLWDIYYLVKNRKPDFDWARCLESNGPIRKTWVMAAIATARDYLQLNVSGLPEEAQRFRLPEWYDKTLAKEWKRGVYPRRVLSTVITRPKLLLAQLYRRFPPNKIAASIDTETPIDDTSRIPSQIKSLTRKVMPFARGIARRLTYSERREQDQPQ